MASDCFHLSAAIPQVLYFLQIGKWRRFFDEGATARCAGRDAWTKTPRLPLAKTIQTALRNVTTLGLAAASSRTRRCQLGSDPGVSLPNTRGVRAPVMAVALAGV